MRSEEFEKWFAQSNLIALSAVKDMWDGEGYWSIRCSIAYDWSVWKAAANFAYEKAAAICDSYSHADHGNYADSCAKEIRKEIT